MQYTPVVIAVLLLVILAMAPVYLKPPQPSTQLTQQEIEQIAANFVNSTIEGAQVTSARVTGRQGPVWNVTVDYNYFENGQCNKAKCYWQGPAAQYCRPESNKSLGPC